MHGVSWEHGVRKSALGASGELMWSTWRYSGRLGGSHRYRICFRRSWSSGLRELSRRHGTW